MEGPVLCGKGEGHFSWKPGASGDPFPQGRTSLGTPWAIMKFWQLQGALCFPPVCLSSPLGAQLGWQWSQAWAECGEDIVLLYTWAQWLAGHSDLLRLPPLPHEQRTKNFAHHPVLQGLSHSPLQLPMTVPWEEFGVKNSIRHNELWINGSLES